MMGQLEHIEPTKNIPANQLFLGRRLDVSRQCEPAISVADEQHDRVVIERKPRIIAPIGQTGVDHPYGSSTHLMATADSGRSQDWYSPLVGDVEHEPVAGIGALPLPLAVLPDLLNLELGKHRRHAAHVVVVGMGQHQSVELRHPEPAQGRHHDPLPHIETLAPGPSRVDQPVSAIGEGTLTLTFSLVIRKLTFILAAIGPLHGPLAMHLIT